MAPKTVLGQGVFLNRIPIVDSRNRIWGYDLRFMTLHPEHREQAVAVGMEHPLLAGILDNTDPSALIGNRYAVVKAGDGIAGCPASGQWQKRMIFQAPAPMIQRISSQLEDHWHDGKPVFCATDFVMIENIMPLLPLPVFLKIDAGHRDEADLARITKAVKGMPVTVIATSVNDRAHFAASARAGLNLFQGEFFALPDTSRRSSISPSQTLLLELSAHTARGADIAKIEAILRKNPDLTFGLMDLVHSAYFNVSQNVSSIRQAITLLGYQNMRKWIALMLFTVDRSDPWLNPLFERAFTRARTMEVLAAQIPGTPFGDAAYLTGIFSLMPALLGLSMEEILRTTHLGDDIKEALLAHTGICGKLLKLAGKLETGNYEEGREHACDLGLDLAALLSAQTRAITEYQMPGADEGGRTAGLDKFLDMVAVETPAAQSRPDASKSPSWLRRVLWRISGKHTGAHLGRVS